MSIVDHERKLNYKQEPYKKNIFTVIFFFILFISGTFIRIQNSIENNVLAVCFRIF